MRGIQTDPLWFFDLVLFVFLIRFVSFFKRFIAVCLSYPTLKSLIVFLWLNFLNGPKEPGLWNLRLFNYGIGIHLLQSDDPDNMPAKKTEINPRDCHISFQCESMQMVEKRLQEMKQKYVKRRVEEGGMFVDQMFIHDPDGFMIEMCNCENLPVIPLGSPACIRCPKAISIEQPSSLSCKTWVPSTSTPQGLTYGH